MEHPGELLLQRRAGVTRPLGSARARPEIPDVAAAFLRDQRMLVIATPDDQGRVWASALTGPEGFADAPDERHLLIGALPTGPLAGLFDEAGQDGRDIGVIAIEPATRRRMRVNGRARREGDHLVVRTEQVYSNCPKYIQRREPAFGPARPSEPSGVSEPSEPVERSEPSGVTEPYEPSRPSGVTGPPAPSGPSRLLGAGRALTAAQRRWIGTADTFFIATHVDGLGSDASHRGGAPGFVRVLDERRLAWREYPGNFMFMTLGNLRLNPACGLLFPDWESGGGLRITGRATPGGGEAGEIAFEVEEVVEMAGEVPAPWRFVEASPFNPPLPVRHEEGPSR
ncbi:pyridoxamine 5'-phosphate oxidase family protein [Sphaerisporangium sp. NPDC005289]|uniref:pyridoxamine 5'-phosphate oxidase family protein n=1 Tax=Sphaerisporangium sp. NPDC005289 TaxID=3155247 RepID=UPI0033AEA3E3